MELDVGGGGRWCCENPSQSRHLVVSGGFKRSKPPKILCFFLQENSDKMANNSRFECDILVWLECKSNTKLSFLANTATPDLV